MMDSAVPGFYKKSREDRLGVIKGLAGLDAHDMAVLRDAAGGMPFERADKMVENAIGTFSLPLGIATNFRINGTDRLIPMVIEEPSVIAAASSGAKAARARGGFAASAGQPYSIGQIQVICEDVAGMTEKILDHTPEILELANSKSRTLSAMKKGAKSVACRNLDTAAGTMLIVELLVDVADAMGANITNTMCEAVAPLIEEITGCRCLLKILSNYSTSRMVRATAVFGRDMLGGGQAVNDMLLAFEFADADIYRAVTHNKGIMNGIVAVANATGQDSRAIEAAANAYAASGGRYRSLSRWSRDTDGNLVGMLEMPLAVGIIGGIANIHPVARVCTKILGANTAQELACAMAAAGLAQNFAALRALTTKGIQHGHMRLHARNIAASAGAAGSLIDGIAEQMISEGNVSVGRAKELLKPDRP